MGQATIQYYQVPPRSVQLSNPPLLHSDSYLNLNTIAHPNLPVSLSILPASTFCNVEQKLFLSKENIVSAGAR